MSSFASFRDLALAPSLADALDKMNFLNPTPIQEQTIPDALLGRDILGCAQTGTGKTAAFGVPLVQYLLNNPDRKALVLAPTRELADQIHRTIAQLTLGAEDMRIALIIGGASMYKQIRTLSFGVRIIVATPGRLIDLLNQKKVKLSSVGVLVLDEVDRMLDMGFAPQLEQIVPHLPAKRQSMLFSATLPKEIMKLTESYLHNPLRVSVGEQSTPAQNVEQRMINIEQSGKNELLLRELGEKTGKTIVFVRTQHGTERLAKLVRTAGFQADRLHGGRTQGQRKRALDMFRKGETQVLLATDIAGRGIDIDDIEFVINFDMPKTHEDYIHRIGRTGRYGRAGIAINFVTSEDGRLMRILTPDAFKRPQRNEAGPRHGSSRPQQAPRAGQGRPRSGEQASGRRNDFGDRRPSGNPPRRAGDFKRADGGGRPAPRGGEDQRRQRPADSRSNRSDRSQGERSYRHEAEGFKKRPSFESKSEPKAEGQNGEAPKKKSRLAQLFRWE